jgi:class 3 adenylate cyclase/tetratricopeptide (TPR) repeat protein
MSDRSGEAARRRSTEEVVSSQSALEGERKHITVLFADVKGSLELLAERDPDEARLVIDGVVAAMIEAVRAYEGLVNQVMGDGIMALFGAPLAREDHAVCGCFAALRMQRLIGDLARDFRQRHGVPVLVRIGLNSGEVVVRSISSDLGLDYSAIGLTTHLAARMEQLAAPGSINVTERTRRLAEGHVTTRPLGPVAIKGLPAPLEVFELVGPAPGRSRFQLAASRGLSRFVGRQGQLAQLALTADRARAGRGRAVAVVGDPGIGKSRLVREFTGKLAADGWRVLETAAVSYGVPAAHLPVRALLRTYFQIDEGDDAQQVREMVATGLVRLDAALLADLPPLLTLLDVPVDEPAWRSLDDVQRRTRLADAVARLVARASEAAPVCLVVEDLQWLDPDSAAIVGRLLDGVPASRVLLVLTHRPKHDHGWGHRAYFMDLVVDPLPEAQVEELLDGLLGTSEDTRELKGRLVRWTEGNPFFVEEAVRHLVATGALVGTRGAYQPGATPVEVTIPETVHAVLAGRIDQLLPGDKRILQAAAVIGRDVALPLLEAVSERPPEEVRHALTRLTAAELLDEIRMFPASAYAFRHALTLEVAYDGLIQDRRQTLHAACVRAIETIHGDRATEHAERLAHHAMLGKLWDRAVHYSREAAARSLGRAASRTAVAHLERALAALEHVTEGPEKTTEAIDVRLALRAALSPLGEFGKLFAHLREAAAIAEGTRDRRRLGVILAFLTNFFTVMLEFDQAFECGERARSLGEELHEPAILVPARLFLSVACFALGRYPRAIDLCRADLTRPVDAMAEPTFGMALPPAVYRRSVLGWCLAETGDFGEAIGLGIEAMQLAERLGQPYAIVFAASGLGIAHLRRGDAGQAVAVLERGLDASRTAQLPGGAYLVRVPLASALVLAGRVDDAIALLHETVEEAKAVGNPMGHWVRTGGLAEAYLAAGRVDEALARIRRGVEITRLVRGRGLEAWALYQLGEVASASPGFVDQAIEAYHGARTICGELGMHPLAARCGLGLGRQHARLGALDDARLELEGAVTTFRELDMPFWTARAEIEQARAAIRDRDSARMPDEQAPPAHGRAPQRGTLTTQEDGHAGERW